MFESAMINKPIIEAAKARKLERLRDEFAMHCPVIIDGYGQSTMEAIVGRKLPESTAENVIDRIKFYSEFEMGLRYINADAALKAREQSK